jgi:hypothetical protein
MLATFIGETVIEKYSISSCNNEMRHIVIMPEVPSVNGNLMVKYMGIIN